VTDFDPRISSLLNLDVPLRTDERPDWADVLARATPATASSQGTNRRAHASWARWPRAAVGGRARVGALAFVLLAAIATPALAFHRQIVDFISAPKASTVVVKEFGALEVLSEQGTPLGALPHSARRVTSVELNGRDVVLSVTPTKGGGYCAYWSGFGVDCGASRTNAKAFGSFHYAADPGAGVTLVQGSTIRRAAEVQVEYADSKRVTVPIVWVTAPIRAGFFLFAVPEDRQMGARRPVAVVATDDGDVIERLPIVAPRQTATVNHTDRWGRVIETPSEAVWPQRRLLVSFNAADNSLVSLYLMPSRQSSSRRCWVILSSSDCGPADVQGPPVQLAVTSTSRTGSAILSGQVRNVVSYLGLNFEDGRQMKVTPKQAFVLAPIPRSHWTRGHRLTEITGYSAAGEVVGRQAFDPRRRNTYPCTTLHDYGYGVRMCP
jgi:hypothetical protein